MKRIKISLIEEVIELNNGELICISIENQLAFRRLFYDVLNKKEDVLVYSENYNVKDEFKYGLMIFDIMQIDINDKKILSTVYTRLTNDLSDEAKLKLVDVNAIILDVFESLSFDFNVPITFNDDFQLAKLLNIYNFRFETTESCDILSLLVAYIKLQVAVSDYRYIVSFDILKYFSVDEQVLLKKELEFMNLALVNIEIGDIRHADDAKTIVLDEDMCLL